MILAIIFSMLSGVTIVISRTTNAMLSLKSNTLVSTFYNYIIGLIVSILFFLIFYGPSFDFIYQESYPSLFYYFGGPLGILAVFFSAYLALRIPSLVMTLLLSFGQIASGLVLDYYLTNTFDKGNVIGGLLVFIGLLFINQKEKNKE